MCYWPPIFAVWPLLANLMPHFLPSLALNTDFGTWI